MFRDDVAALSPRSPRSECARRIIVLGGGFGGAYCAQSLERALAGLPADVILLDRNNYFTFYPLLIEAGVGNLDPRHVVVALRSFLRRGSFRMADAIDLDKPAQEVIYQVVGAAKPQRLPYDHLVIAVGSVTRMPDVPGLREHGFQLKSLGDAVALRDRMIQLLEVADATDDPVRRRVLLHLVVVGGNYTGVEVAGEFSAFMRSAARHYPRISPQDCHVTLIDRGERILSALDRDLSDYATDHMRRRGIDILLGASAARLERDRVILLDGRALDAHTTIWCAGIAPSPLLARLGLPLSEQGYLRCDADLRVEGHNNIWAVGDCAQIPDPRGGHYPATAQHALQEGQHLARNIARALRGQPIRPFVYSTRGSLAGIGCRTGVAKIFGFKLAGSAAWFAYRTLYLFKMPGLGRKIRIALDWTMDLLFGRENVQLGVHRVRSTPPPPASPPVHALASNGDPNELPSPAPVHEHAQS